MNKHSKQADINLNTATNCIILNFTHGLTKPACYSSPVFLLAEQLGQLELQFAVPAQNDPN